MTAEQKQAYEWAKNQNYQSVAARYAKELCRVIAALQAENAAKVQEIERLRKENERLALNGGRYMTIAEQRYELYSHALDTIEKRETELADKKAALSRVEAERDASNGYLEKIDGMFGTAYPNEILAVLDEWRGAQGEG